MNKTDKRGMKYAIRGACLSSLRCRVGAALFYKKKLLGIGWNIKKSHPRCPTEHSQHAEFNVCIGLDKTILSNGCTLYVVRLTKTGRIEIAKPCEICQEFLQAICIDKIFYTDREGKLNRL